jgi:hypothetical protein
MVKRILTTKIPYPGLTIRVTLAFSFIVLVISWFSGMYGF